MTMDILTLEDLIPSDWAKFLQGGSVCFGLDVASTINDKSNPSAFCVMEKWENLFYQRLVARWKVDDYKTQLALVRHIITQVPFALRKYLMVDNSNEKFAANLLKSDLAGVIRVKGIAGNNAVIYAGEKTDAKTAMGKAYSDALENGWVAMPPAPWISRDHRLVKRNGAKFEAEMDEFGNHADTFDGGKLAYWGHLEKGKPPMPRPGSKMKKKMSYTAGRPGGQRRRLKGARTI